MLADYFKDTVTISRSVVTGNKTMYAAIPTPIACHIQPLDDSYSQGEAGRMGKSFLLFSTSEVRIGDRLEDQAGVKYECYGAKRHKFRNRSHYEATLRGV